MIVHQGQPWVGVGSLGAAVNETTLSSTRRTRLFKSTAGACRESELQLSAIYSRYIFSCFVSEFVYITLDTLSV